MQEISSTITPHLVGWTPTVQNSLPALHTQNSNPQAHYIKHLTGTNKTISQGTKSE